MIIKIVDPRKDGRTSFKSLANYIAFGEENVSRGEPLFFNIVGDDVDSAWKEMQLNFDTRDKSVRIKDPVYHIVVSWQEHENPTQEQAQIVNREIAKCLERNGKNLTSHQSMAILHRDTDNYHLHNIFNRIDIDTGKALTPYLSKIALSKVARELEKRFGWDQDNGIYMTDENGNIVRTPREILEENRSKKTSGDKAEKAEKYSNNESFEKYVKQFSREINALKNDKNLTWQRLHQELLKHDLRLNKGEKGGFTISDLTQSNHVKASDVFRNLFSGKNNRIWRDTQLGEFENFNGEYPNKTFDKYKITKEEEEELTDPNSLIKSLNRLYYREREKHLIEFKPKLEQKKLDLKLKNKEFFNEFKRQKSAIWNNRHLSRDDKNFKISGLSLELQLKKQAALFEFQKWKTENTFPSKINALIAFRDDLPNDDFINRGIITNYVEQLKAKTKSNPRHFGEFRVVIFGENPKILTPGRNLNFERLANGNIVYKVNGQEFVDEKTKIALPKFAKDETIIEALRLANLKFNKIKINGSPELKVRIARLVAEKGLKIGFNDEMRKLVESQRKFIKQEQIEAEQKRLAEAKAEAERKRLAEAKAEAERKRLAEAKAEAERKRLAEAKAEAERKRLEEAKANAIIQMNELADQLKDIAKDVSDQKLKNDLYYFVDEFYSYFSTGEINEFSLFNINKRLNLMSEWKEYALEKIEEEKEQQEQKQIPLIKNGDYFRGTIIQIDDKEAILQLDDGSKVKYINPENKTNPFSKQKVGDFIWVDFRNQKQYIYTATKRKDSHDRGRDDR